MAISNPDFAYARGIPNIPEPSVELISEIAVAGIVALAYSSGGGSGSLFFGDSFGDFMCFEEMGKS